MRLGPSGRESGNESMTTVKHTSDAHWPHCLLVPLYSYVCTQAYAHIRAHMHAHTRASLHTLTGAHTHAHNVTRVCAHVHAHEHTSTRGPHTRTCALTRTRARAAPPAAGSARALEELRKARSGGRGGGWHWLRTLPGQGGGSSREGDVERPRGAARGRLAAAGEARAPQQPGAPTELDSQRGAAPQQVGETPPRPPETRAHHRQPPRAARGRWPPASGPDPESAVPLHPLRLRRGGSSGPCPCVP